MNLPTDTPDLGAVNRWATAEGLRENLLLWASAALPVAADVETEVSIDYKRGEVPDSATVTVVQDGFRDDSVRGHKFVLKFSRKPCETCESSMTPWWLWSLEAAQRCWPGRGHEDYAKERCH